MFVPILVRKHKYSLCYPHTSGQVWSCFVSPPRDFSLSASITVISSLLSIMCLTLQVYTMSLHLKEDGFFPGSGDSENVGLGNGRCGLSARLVHIKLKSQIETNSVTKPKLNDQAPHGISALIWRPLSETSPPSPFLK